MHFFFFPRASARLLLVFTACAAAASWAQAASAPPPTQLAPMVVQGRETDLVGEAVSASQGSVGAAELESRPWLRRGELLEVIPGVVITQHSGNGKANQYFLRGFNLDHGTDFSLAVDGMPVNLRSHAHGQGYADLNFVIPEAVRQVDYNKGPFYAEVGDFSAAGAAHFRLVDAVARPFVTLGAGENGFARVAMGGTAQRGGGALTGVFEASHDDGPWRLPEDGKRFNGFGRWAGRTSAMDYRLTALAYRGEWRATDQIPRRAVEAGALERFGYVDDSDGGKSERVSMSADATWRDSVATTRVNAYALRYRLDLYSNFTYFLDDALNGDQFNQRDGRTVLGGALERTWSQMGARPGETTIGLQGQMDFVDELGLHRTARRVRLGTVRDDTVKEGSAAVFVRDERRWSEWMRSVAGVRFDGYRFAVQSGEPRNSGTRLADAVSPKLALAFGPWWKTEVYLNAGYGFHSNDARGTTIRVDPEDGVTPVDRVTPLARSRGVELGLRTAPVPGWVTTIAVWGLDLDSELVFVGDAGGTEPNGRTRRQGVELANFWRVTPWLALDADFAATRARYREDAGGGRRIANSIAAVATGGVVFGGKTGGFGAVRGRYFGPQPLIEDNSVRAPSSTTVNLQLGWRGERWTVAVDVLNALDRAHYDIAYAYPSRLPGEPVEGVDDVHFHPAEPRTVRVALTRHW